MTDIARIDPRGQRWGAAITSVLLAGALVAGPSWGLIPLVIALAAFAAGAVFGLDKQPWGLLYRHLIRPRLGPPAELEDPRPPRFAQAVGLGFAVIALAGALAGLAVVFYAAAALALLAALLNALFDFCLGCEVWAIVQRLRHREVGQRRVAAH